MSCKKSIFILGNEWRKKEKINHALLSKYCIVLVIIKTFILKISIDYEINTK